MAAGESPLAAPAEPNPFSFHEFVRSKARSGEEAGGARQVGPGQRHDSPQPFCCPQAVPSGPSLGPLLLPDPAPLGEVEDEDEEEWSGSYQPSAVEQAHLTAAGPASPAAASSFFFEGAGLGGGGERSLGAPEGPGFPSLRQPSYEELKEENASLRSKINKLQIFSETQADKMRKLERKLEENKIKEEKEAQDLEAMVQHVEQNLQLMTEECDQQVEGGPFALMIPHLSTVPNSGFPSSRRTGNCWRGDSRGYKDKGASSNPVPRRDSVIPFQKRAVKAENNATKLKQENALLQVQLKNYKTENEALRSGQSASLAAVKRNADLALQNLLTVLTRSRSSITQLVSGAESLQLVADLLRSIDRMSEVPEDGQ